MNTAPGYLNIGTAVLHVSEVRRFTKDIHRFRDYLPLAVQLSRTDTGTQAAFDIYDEAKDFDMLLLTLEELASLNFEMADQLKATNRR